MFVFAVASDPAYPRAYRKRPDESAMRFYRDFDYAVDWCAENFGRSGTRWRVQGHTIEFASEEDAERFIGAHR